MKKLNWQLLLFSAFVAFSTIQKCVGGEDYLDNVYPTGISDQSCYFVNFSWLSFFTRTFGFYLFGIIAHAFLKDDNKD